MNELTARVALVLGVERPAGRRAAVALAEAGADVAVVTLTESTPAEFAANSAGVLSVSVTTATSAPASASATAAWRPAGRSTPRTRAEPRSS